MQFDKMYNYLWISSSLLKMSNLLLNEVSISDQLNGQTFGNTIIKKNMFRNKIQFIRVNIVTGQKFQPLYIDLINEV